MKPGVSSRAQFPFWSRAQVCELASVEVGVLRLLGPQPMVQRKAQEQPVSL